MKIAVIGPYGSKKRAVCSFLDLYLKRKQIPVRHIDVISALQRQGLEFDEKTNLNKQETIFRFQQAFECMLELEVEAGKIKYALFDKSIMDIYVYTQARFPNEAGIFYPKLEDWVTRHPYDFLYKPERLNNGQITDEKTKFQHELDRKLEDLLKELNIECRIIPRTFFQESEEQKIKKFNEYFGKLIK